MSFDYETAVQACGQGDRQALKSLYDREARWLLGVALRIVREKQLAEDIVQDAFLLIWQRAETFNASLGSARGWIYTIVRHRALDEVRRPGFKRKVEVEDVRSTASKSWRSVLSNSIRRGANVSRPPFSRGTLRPSCLRGSTSRWARSNPGFGVVC